MRMWLLFLALGVLIAPFAEASGPRRLAAGEQMVLTPVEGGTGHLYLDTISRAPVTVHFGGTTMNVTAAAQVVSVHGMGVTLETEGPVYAAYVPADRYGAASGQVAWVPCDTGAMAWSAARSGAVLTISGDGPAVAVYGGDPQAPFLLGGLGTSKATIPERSSLLWVVHSAAPDCAGSTRMVISDRGLAGIVLGSPVVPLALVVVAGLLGWLYLRRRKRAVGSGPEPVEEAL